MCQKYLCAFIHHSHCLVKNKNFILEINKIAILNKNRKNKKIYSLLSKCVCFGEFSLSSVSLKWGSLFCSAIIIFMTFIKKNMKCILFSLCTLWSVFACSLLFVLWWMFHLPKNMGFALSVLSLKHTHSLTQKHFFFLQIWYGFCPKTAKNSYFDSKTKALIRVSWRKDQAFSFVCLSEEQQQQCVIDLVLKWRSGSCQLFCLLGSYQNLILEKLS